MTRTDSIVVGIATTVFVTISIALVQFPVASDWMSNSPLATIPVLRPRSLFGAWYSAWHAARHSGNRVECLFEPDIFWVVLNIYCAILAFVLLRGQVQQCAVWCLGMLALLLSLYSVAVLIVVVMYVDSSVPFVYVTFEQQLPTHFIPLSIAASITLVLRLTLPRDTSAPVHIPRTGSSAS